MIIIIFTAMDSSKATEQDKQLKNMGINGFQKF
jgi:hypothetical protein